MCLTAWTLILHHIWCKTPWRTSELNANVFSAFEEAAGDSLKNIFKKNRHMDRENLRVNVWLISVLHSFHSVLINGSATLDQEPRVVQVSWLF